MAANNKTRGLDSLRPVWATLVLIFILFNVAAAGDRLDIPGLGLARSSVAFSRGLEAVGINPANLGLPDQAALTFTVLPLSGYLTSDFFSYNLYSNYLKNKTPLLDLAESDKQKILSSFAGPTGNASAEMAARLFGVLVRISPGSSFAFTVDYGLVGGATIPKEYARLLLYGNTPGELFNVDGLALQAFWGRSYVFSYGQLLPKPEFLSWLSGGVSLKMVQGYGYYEVQNLSTSLRAKSDGTLSGAALWQARWSTANSLSDPLHNSFQDPAGYGLGADFGLSGGIDNLISFAVSVTDLGWVRWSKDILESTSDSVLTSANAGAFRNFQSITDSMGAAKTGQPFTRSLPATLRVGVSFQLDRIAGAGDFPGELLIATEFQQGIGPGTPLREAPRFSFGMEYRPVHWLPLRTGVAVGGINGPELACGFGFNFPSFAFDVGTEDILGMSGGSTAGIGAAISIRVGR